MSGPRPGPGPASAIDWAASTRLRATIAVASILFAIYLPTATWTYPVVVDVLTNVISAERIASTGSPVLPEEFSSWTEPPFFRGLGWVVESQRGLVSQYPPGAAGFGALFYWALPEAPPEDVTLSVGADADAPASTVPIPPIWPATLAAVVAVVVAAASLTWALWGHLPPRSSMATGLLFGLGTSAWAIAANGLWLHSTAIAGIGLAGALVAARPLAAGLAHGLAVLSRPHLAVVAAAVGVGGLVGERRWRTFLGVAAGSLTGMALLIAYNRWFFGTWSVLGGYRESFGRPDGGFLWIVGNLLEGLVGVPVGLVLWSPFLVVGAIGCVGAWRDAPNWMRSAAVGGVAYYLLQFSLHRAYPDFLPYRYPLEAVFAAAPLLAMGLHAVWVRGRRWRSALVILVGASVVLQALAVVLTFR